MADVQTDAVNVVDPLGNVGSLPKAEASEAMDHGYRSATIDEIAHAKNEERFGGVQGAALATTLGAARSATFGLSDLALTRTEGSPFTKEQVQGLRETNPSANLIGEVGGLLVDPMGIAGMISKAGKATSAGAKSILNAARIAEDSSKVSQVLSSAAGHAAEGAVFGGAVSTIDDLALGDPSINGEKVLANIGMGSLLGGSTGAAFKLIGFGVTPAVRKAMDGLAAIRNDLVGSGFGEEALVHKVLPKRFAEAITDRQLNVDTQGQAATLRKIVNNLNHVTDSVQEELSGFESDKNKDAISAMFPKPRRDFTSSEVGQKSLQNQLASAEEAKQTAQSGFTKANPDMADDVAGKGKFWDSDLGKTFIHDHTSEIERIRGGISEAQTRVAEQIGSTVDQLSKVIPTGPAKEFLDSLKSKATFGKYIGGSAEDAYNYLKDMRGKISGFLKKEPDLTESLAPINDTIHEVMKDPKIFGAAGAASALHDETVAGFRNFVSAEGRPTEFQRLFGEMKGGKWQFDIQKVNNVLAEKDFIVRAHRMNMLSDFFQHLENMPENMLNARKAVPNSSWKKETISQIIENSKKTNEQAYNDYIEGVKTRRPVYGWRDYAPVLIAKWHPVIAAAIEAYDFYQDPVHATHELALIERYIGKTTKKTLDLIDAIFNPSVVSRELIESKRPKLDKKSDNDEREQRIKRLKMFAGNPQELSDAMDKGTNNMHESAPNISQHFQVATSAAVAFLNSKLPQNDDHANPFSKPYKPSANELAKFDNYARVVENPLVSLEQIRKRTITPETVEALRVVYPKFYEQMKQNLLEKAFDHHANKKSIPFQTRQAIGFFLGQPIEQALQGQSILTNQMVMSAAQQQQQAQGQGQMKTRAKGLDNMGKADRAGADYGAMSDKV